MNAGVVHTSSAPAVMAAATASGTSSGEQSSRFVSSSTTSFEIGRSVSFEPSSLNFPSMTRTIFGRCARSRRPAPYPTVAMRIEGNVPKLDDNDATSAAPVGVTSSIWMSTPSVGMPLSISSVAGAGSGSMPCADFTKPRPSGSGEQTTSSTSSNSSATDTPTTSAMESSDPTS